MFRCIKRAFRHVFRYYRCTLLALSALVSFSDKLRGVLLNDGDTYLVYLFVLLVAITSVLLVLAIRQDKTERKERIARQNERREQANQFRSAKREFQRRKAKSGNNELGNYPEQPDD